MNRVVLDASALLTLLHSEPGHEMVAGLIPHSIISTINVTEVITVLINRGMPAEKAVEAVSDVLNETLPFDLKQATEAACLITETKKYGLSLGDRACLSLGKLKKLPVLTADKIWNKLKVGVEIQLLR
ncbi:PIN domain-containing protein [soil metagenome]